MTKRLVILGALLLLVLPSVATTQAASPAAKGRPRAGRVVPGSHPVLASKAISGTITNVTTSGLTMTAGGVSYTVNVSSTTKIVRRFNGQSDLDELSPGDQVTVSGAVSTTTISAVAIKDVSIQEAWTRLMGTLQAVSGATAPTTATVTVLKDRRNAPFTVGQSIPLAIGTATRVLSPTVGSMSVMTGTAALPTLSASVGSTVTVLGVYNSVQKSYTTVFRVRILRAVRARSSQGSGSTGSGSGSTGSGSGSTGTGSGSPGSGTGSVPAGQAINVGGSLVSLSSITAPASLTVQTQRFGLITINIGTSPAVQFVRRYNGQSGLDELSAGDQVAVQGSFTDSTNKTVNATSIKDYSIQDAATRAILQITQTNATGFVGTVMTDLLAVPHPFNIGQTITVTVDSSTKFTMPATAPATGYVTASLSNLAANQTVTVLGTFNRRENTLINTVLVRIHR